MPADILSTPELAALTGLSRKTIWTRGQTSPRWSACIIGQTKRSTDWSRKRLTAAGILDEPQADAKPEPVRVESLDEILGRLASYIRALQSRLEAVEARQ